MGSATHITITQLNSFLRGEITAVETYRQALTSVKDSALKLQLESVRMSHERRVQLLAHRVRQAGGMPSTGSGSWGTFAKAVQGGADMLGDKAAIAALEEGEDHGKRDYAVDLTHLDHATRNFVTMEIVPMQEHTHAVLSAIKKSFRPEEKDTWRATSYPVQPTKLAFGRGRASLHSGG